jgi:hypothetical protein
VGTVVAYADPMDDELSLHVSFDFDADTGPWQLMEYELEKID